MKIGVTYNLKKEVKGNLPQDYYAEWDDMETIEAVRDALLEKHDEVVLIEADESAYERLRQTKPDMVFNMAEGLGGESREAHLPSIMELLNIPYTGSAPLTLSLCLNKARAKEVLSYYGIPTPRFIVAETSAIEFERYLNFPMIVKPLYEGSSKGIRNDSVVYSTQELRRKIDFIISMYRQPAIVEEHVGGREFTVAILGNGSRLKVLPLVEIDFSALPSGATPIYSYEAKWVFDRPDKPLDIFICPAKIDDRLRKAIEEVSRDAFRALQVRDWCRIDIRLDSTGVPNVLELNPIPGILPDPKSNSCFPKAARAAGMSFSTLINTVVDIARQRYGV